MVGRILPERQELKVGMLIKRAQNKSRFFTYDNYKERVFVLERHSLVYYSGTLQKREDEKGNIALTDILAVETLVDKRSPKSGFQVSYEEDGEPYILYVFGKGQEDRDVWIQAIREEALKNGAFFIQSYHPARWKRGKGFRCCGAPSRGDEGCTPVTKQVTETRERLLSRASSSNPGELLADMMSKRSQGKSTFFGAINYKERVFVLELRSFRYFAGNLRVREGEKGSIELCSVRAVENVRDGLLENRKNAFQVVYADDDDNQVVLVMVARSANRRQMWVQALRDEAKKNSAQFQSHYHPGVWIKGMGKYNCCQDIDKDSKGCEPVTIDLTSYNRSAEGADKEEVKVAILTKRAQNKSLFYVSKSYKERLFVLDHSSLRYFKGSVKKRGEEKYRIDLSSIVTVATVDAGALDGHRNAFQVVYIDAEDNQQYQLYLVAPSSGERHDWVTAITSEASKAGALLSQCHHGGVWNKRVGKFSCCGQMSRDAKGCIDSDAQLTAVSPSPQPVLCPSLRPAMSPSPQPSPQPVPSRSHRRASSSSSSSLPSFSA